MKLLNLRIFLFLFFFLFSMAGFQFGEHLDTKPESTPKESNSEATSKLLQAS